MSPTFSLVVNHAPWAIERTNVALGLLIESAREEVKSTWLHDIDYRDGGPSPKGKPVPFSVNQWNWAAQQKTTHHVFMTDDIELQPSFWRIVSAMVEAAPEDVIGLLSNHPRAPILASEGYHWYRTNSWIVGPCYVLPHAAAFDLADWAERRFPVETWDKLGWADDSELNHWVSTRGRRQALHPIPTPIEHARGESTWQHTGHGDDYAHERVCWKGFEPMTRANMASLHFWTMRGGPQAAPMLELPR